MRPRYGRLLTFVLLLAGGAHAEDRWTDPYPGVRHLARTDRYAYDDRPQYRLQALVVDLRHPAVRVVATPPNQAGGTVSQFAERLGVDAAWNTNFFGSPQDSCGLMVGEGQVWPRAYQDDCHASVGFGDEGQAAVFVQPNPQGPPPEGWMRQVATGKPGPILVGGQAQFLYGCGAQCAYNPRTGIGLSQDRRTLYVVVVDGRQEGTAGAGLDDLANLMRDLGAWDAVNLDGGGSSTLFVRNEGGVQNRPSDGGERTVCCHMGLRIDPNPPGPPPADAGPPPIEDAAPRPAVPLDGGVGPADDAHVPARPDAGSPPDGTSLPDATSLPDDASLAQDTARPGDAPQDAGPDRPDPRTTDASSAGDGTPPGPVRPRGGQADVARHEGGCRSTPGSAHGLLLWAAAACLARARRRVFG